MTKLEKSDALDFEIVMKTPEGARLIARLMDQAGVFKPVYDETHATMAFREGQRNFGLMLYLEGSRHKECLDKGIEQRESIKELMRTEGKNGR